MEGSAPASSSASAEDGPESWEVADVEASMHRLMLSSKKDTFTSSNKQDEMSEVYGSGSNQGSSFNLGSGMSEDLINTVDQFLREAIQNPRERLSVLRMEQDVEKFIRDPTREQMEFQQLPTSYLRLAAHRVAQHYSLQSMVLLDNNLPDGSGSRIIVRKTSNIRIPLVRLADIPVNLPTEENNAIKVAIKQRPHKGFHSNSNLNANPAKSNSSKSVEERKEEYNKARARIFSSTNSSGSSNGKSVSDPRIQDSIQHGSVRTPKAEERISPSPGSGSNVTIGRSLSDSSTSSSRLIRSRIEKEPVARPKMNNRVAIFRDREVDRKDPDYDRSYDRYMQRFDPGFGFSGCPYPIQPMYAPAINYNTEFPQLGASHRLPISTEHQTRPLPQHLPGPWIAPSPPAGIGYGPTEGMLSPFTTGHVGPHSNSSLYLHSAQYPCQTTGLPYIQRPEPIHQPFPQSHQQQADSSFGVARPR
ncbi:Single-stranded nucleic acid binding R3H protein [Striga hermonthica]|uniref:Single-stranded nucleic acid binding R3H protein n=1 Tax=Striga hermonthica TaxID=68872 RepID=A0A9N7MTB1_STRHE|nr:Single-stranded nucleic acid binding R3H protein [Striga hermonthica]